MKLRVLVLGLLLAAAPAFAADVDGKWTGSIDSPNGPVQVNYTFKADGKMLTGSTTGPDGNAIPIKDGKVDGSNISFAIDLDFGQGPMTLKYTGVVSLADIKIKADFNGMPFEFTVKKVS